MPPTGGPSIATAVCDKPSILTLADLMRRRVNERASAPEARKRRRRSQVTLSRGCGDETR